MSCNRARASIVAASGCSSSLTSKITGPGSRRWLLETIFGVGDEFEYRSDSNSK